MYILKINTTLNLLETLLTDTSIDVFDITHIYHDYYSQNAIFMPQFITNNKIKTGLLNFCYLFGSNLREKQLELAFKLHQELLQDTSNFHQLLMGEGKSSVVAPVLTILLKYSNIYRIFHVMPESLIPQAIQNFNKIFYYLKNLKIHTTKDKSYNLEDIDIHIVSDSYLKKNKLIKGYNEKFKTIISESTFIYDEIDEIADPLKSQYNILTDNNGELIYVCTDPSRGVFKFKDTTGELKKDLEAKKLTSYILEGGIKNKSADIGNEWCKDDTGEFDMKKFTILMVPQQSIMNLSQDNNVLKKELASLTS